MKWAMGLGVVIGILVVFASAAGAGLNPDAKLAMHLIASGEYLDCEDFELASIDDINPDLSMEELAAASYCGYVVFVVYDLGVAMTGCEYFVTGWPMGRGAPLFAGPDYCGRIALCLGEPFEAFGGEGGIVALGGPFVYPETMSFPFGAISFDLSAHTSYLPITLDFSPSRFQYPSSPHNYVLGPWPNYSEDPFVEEHGCVIGTDGLEETLELASPNGGESWHAGSTPPIEWSSSYIQNVRLEYSINGGLSWQDIVASTSSIGLYLWDLPDSPSTDCLIRISDADDGVPSDVSDAPFSIVSGSGFIVEVPSEWPCIQYGIYGAAPGDTVLVGQGTYYESINMKSGVTVRSQNGPAATTIVGSGPYHVVVFECDGTDACLEGFTITGGNACGFSSRDMIGGGVVFGECGGTVSDCWITGNSADYLGGGIGGYGASEVTISRCVIHGNTANVGGGLGLFGGDAQVISSDIVGNAIGEIGGGVGLDGFAHCALDHTIIAFNQGGHAFSWDGTAELQCCDVYGNVGGPGSVASQIGTNGNFAEDPFYTDWQGGDFTLRLNSPCLTGYGCGLIGSQGAGRAGHTRVEPETWSRIKAKYRMTD